MPMEASDSRSSRGGGERQVGVCRSCVAAVDQFWHLKPATWRRPGADTLKAEGCSPLLPGTVVRLVLQRNGPAMAQRLAVAPTRILYTVCSHSDHLRPED
jgi:hypothetical protein